MAGDQTPGSPNQTLGSRTEYSLAIMAIGAALVALFIAAAATGASGHTIPTDLWAAGGGLAGALVGVLIPPPTTNRPAEAGAAAIQAAAVKNAGTAAREISNDPSSTPDEKAAAKAAFADVVEASRKPLASRRTRPAIAEAVGRHTGAWVAQQDTTAVDQAKANADVAQKKAATAVDQAKQYAESVDRKDADAVAAARKKADAAAIDLANATAAADQTRADAEAAGPVRAAEEVKQAASTAATEAEPEARTAAGWAGVRSVVLDGGKVVVPAVIFGIALYFGIEMSDGGIRYASCKATDVLKSGETAPPCATALFQTAQAMVALAATTAGALVGLFAPTPNKAGEGSGQAAGQA